MSVCQESSEHAPLSHVFSSSKQMTQFKSPFSLIPPSFLNNPIEHEIQNYQIPLFTNSKTPAFPSPRFPGTKNEKKNQNQNQNRGIPISEGEGSNPCRGGGARSHHAGTLEGWDLTRESYHQLRSNQERISERGE